MNKFLITLITFLTITAVSCSNDDTPQMPTNAISLNMMIGDNETTIGGSDVFINSSLNFTSSYCAIADLGKKSGFNQNPILSQIAQEIAITPGNFYQITLAQNIQIVAGSRALPINTNYYNVYVDSWIYDKDNDIAGAKISYAECHPQTKQLPEWESIINVRLNEHESEYIETATYSFPKGCKIDDSYDLYFLEGQYDMSENLEVDIKDGQIMFSNRSYAPDSKVRVVVSVRYENIYTRVFIDVESSI